MTRDCNIPTRFGVVDIGSNTVKLSVFACDNADEPRELVSDADTVRIGYRVSETGRISDERLERLLDTLLRFEAMAAELGATEYHAVATQAFRIATNTADVVARIERETRWHVRVIEASEETQLTIDGARPWLEPGAANIVADIGGASTEVITVRPDGSIAGAGSIPIGSGLLFDEEIGTSPPPAGSLLAARARATAVLNQSGWLPKHAPVLLLPGGTGHFLTLLLESISSGSTLNSQSLPLLSDWLGSRHAAETMQRIPVQLDRAQVLPASFAIVEALVLRTDPQRIRAVPSGIRSAIARSRCEDR